MGEALTGLKRSCMCCDVNESMIGQEVTVMGWVQRRRDLGKLIFIALRDKTGLVQIESMATQQKRICSQRRKRFAVNMYWQ